VQKYTGIKFCILKLKTSTALDDFPFLRKMPEGRRILKTITFCLRSYPTPQAPRPASEAPHRTKRVGFPAREVRHPASEVGNRAREAPIRASEAGKGASEAR
jgi:hypothetical protein